MKKIILWTKANFGRAMFMPFNELSVKKFDITDNCGIIRKMNYPYRREED
jgi:hypothetical protein